MRGRWRKQLLACGLVLALTGLAGPAAAVTWEFGTAGKGENPFMPRGYLIATEDGLHWLSSRFDNSGSTTMYSSKLNGLSYIDATKVDGSGYTLYAFTDRNPKKYQYLIAYCNGELIPDFASHAGAPGRLSDLENIGSGANWAIPIQGFEFEPGCYYEFAFQRGMQANNGVTLVFSSDGLGYIQNPSTDEEVAKYEAEQYQEYEFVSSYWKEEGEDGSYVYNFHLVPMRFAVQTYADVSLWEDRAEEARAFLDSVPPEQVDGVRYHQANLDNLRLLLDSQQEQIQRSVRLKLQPEAEALMEVMNQELDSALELARSASLLKSDVSVLEELLTDARALYETASGNQGTGQGQYAPNRVEELAAAIAAAEELDMYSPQAEINGAIETLRAAVVQTYNSVVREERMILRDEASGVVLLAPMGALPEDAVLYVDQVEENLASAQTLREQLGEGAESLSFFEIRVMSGDVVVQPTQAVDVQLPLGEDQRGRAAVVYADRTPDAPARMSAVSTGDKLLFQTAELGTFAVALRASTAEALPEAAESAPPEPSQPPAPESGAPSGEEPPAGAVQTTAPEEEPETVTVVEKTDVPLEQEPEQMKSELEQAPGEEAAPPEETHQPVRADPELLDEVDFTLDGLTRAGQPTVFLLATGGVLLLAAGLAARKAGAAWARTARRGKNRDGRKEV